MRALTMDELEFVSGGIVNGGPINDKGYYVLDGSTCTTTSTGTDVNGGNYSNITCIGARGVGISSGNGQYGEYSAGQVFQCLIDKMNDKSILLVAGAGGVVSAYRLGPVASAALGGPILGYGITFLGGVGITLGSELGLATVGCVTGLTGPIVGGA